VANDRIIPPSVLTGQAAGTAAAIAIRKKCPVADVPTDPHAEDERKRSPKRYAMKKSINLWAFPYPKRMTLEACFRLAKDAGFDAIEVNYNLADQSALVHTAFGASDAALPVSSVVAQWHLMQATGTADPGRNRAQWNQVQAIPYTPGGANQFASIPCSDTINDSWLAIGIGDHANWGQGYGREAIKLMLGFAFNELNLYRVQLSVFSYNQRALALYEKLGFQREGTFREFLHRDGQRYDMFLYGLLRREWEQSAQEE